MWMFVGWPRWSDGWASPQTNRAERWSEFPHPYRDGLRIQCCDGRRGTGERRQSGRRRRPVARAGVGRGASTPGHACARCRFHGRAFSGQGRRAWIAIGVRGAWATRLSSGIARAIGVSSSTDFRLWVLLLGKAKTHRRKSVPPNLEEKKSDAARWWKAPGKRNLMRGCGAIYFGPLNSSQ